MRRGAPVDLVFQSIAGTEAANRSFGVNLAHARRSLAGRARAAARGKRDVLRDRPGQRAVRRTLTMAWTSRPARRGLTRWPARIAPLLVNTVVGFIGPEYLFDGKQIMRAGLEDHFCGKLLGLPMGCDVCYTNHAEADQDDMDALLTMLGVAGCNYIMGVPGADDIMLNYQSTSLSRRAVFAVGAEAAPAPEFEAWLERMGILEDGLRLRATGALPPPFSRALEAAT